MYHEVKLPLIALITSPPTYHNYYIQIICAGVNAEPHRQI